MLHRGLPLNSNDGSALFAQDATFCPRAGNSGTGYSLMSDNYSNKYIRHFNFTGYVASDGGANAWDATSLWSNDTSWLAASPRAKFLRGYARRLAPPGGPPSER